MKRRTERYFCSRLCKESFEKDPERYLNPDREKDENRLKVAIVGTGNVGSTFAFSLMTSGLATGIILINHVRERAEGHAMDLNHGLPFVQPSKIHVGDYEDCHGADVVVVTAGVNQKPGETRLDLLQRNTDIFKELILQIAHYAPWI